MSTNTKAVVHYHKDTEQIDATLTKGAVYKTSKGHGIYSGRSQSNGKLLFKNAENTTVNIYFTKDEWVTGGNSPDCIDTSYVRKTSVSVVKTKTVASKLVACKSRLLDITKDNFGGCEATYIGFDVLYGLKVKYKDSAGTVVYFNGTDFNRRFNIVEVGTPDPQPYVPEKKKRTKKRK